MIRIGRCDVSIQWDILFHTGQWFFDWKRPYDAPQNEPVYASWGAIGPFYLNWRKS